MAQQPGKTSEDHDREREDEGLESNRKRGYDESVRGQDLGDVNDRDLDPDSPKSENERDDMMTDE